MSLLEEQVVRYSRQILLAQVGGRGQERLLGTRVQVTGMGAAQSTAVAYLAAGGCAVEERPRPLRKDEVGFLYGEADVGTPADRALGAAGYALNPDSVAWAMKQRHPRPLPRPLFTDACLAQLPGEFTGNGPWVGLGQRGGRGAILYRAEEGCAGCFLDAVAQLAPPTEAPWPELMGALAALSLQRLLLGLGEPLGGLWVDEEARMDSFRIEPCARCRA